MNKRLLLTVAILFIVILAVCYGLHQQFPLLDNRALLAGNIVMALLTLLSFWIMSRTVNNRPQAFVSGVSSTTFLKLFVCMIGILIYVYLNKATLYKPTVFALFGIYILYSAIETVLMSRQARQPK